MYKISAYLKFKYGKLNYILLGQVLILRGYYIPFSSLVLQWVKRFPSIGRDRSRCWHESRDFSRSSLTKIYSFIFSPTYLFDTVYYNQALHQKYKMKDEVVSVSQPSREDKYRQTWNYSILELIKTLQNSKEKNIKDYQKGLIHLEKFYRVHRPVES